MDATDSEGIHGRNGTEVRRRPRRSGCRRAGPAGSCQAHLCRLWLRGAHELEELDSNFGWDRKLGYLRPAGYKCLTAKLPNEDSDLTKGPRVASEQQMT